MPEPTWIASGASALGEAILLDVPSGSPDLVDVRASLGEFLPVDLTPGDVRSALAMVARHATLNPYADLTSRHPAITRLKGATRKLTFFVAHNIAVQVTDLAHTLLVAGSATADRLELVEAENARLNKMVEALQRRLDATQ